MPEIAAIRTPHPAFRSAGSRRPVVVVFSPQWHSHFRRLLPIVRGLVEAGLAVEVFSHVDVAAAVEASGARFRDLFGRYPLALADDESTPLGVRHVSYAAHYGAAVIEEVRRLRARLIIYDTFAVIARVVAHALDLPAVNVCAGHNVHPDTVPAMLATGVPPHPGDACHAAVERLREDFGIVDASPFCYATGLSRWLNVYCEPPQFLSADEHAKFAPIACFGCLPAPEEMPARSRCPPNPAGRRLPIRLYASLGTIVWNAYRDTALAALAAIKTATATRPGVELVISQGGAKLPPELLAALAGRNVRIEHYVDQWATLADCDFFFTHHGLNSTHEAIWHGVPMLSYPIFWDQPSLARTVQHFGLALPLATTLREPLDPAQIAAALDQALDSATAMRERLALARGWEQEVMAARPGVIRRIADLAG